MKTAVLSLATLVLAAGAVLGSQPADRVNFQGVLRSSAGAPLTGTYDMALHLYDAAAGGALIVTDAHTTGNGNPVTVTGGLFNTELGEVLSGGLGYGTLRDVFRDYGTVWVQVQVGAETLTPRVAVAAAPHALNCENANVLDGMDSSAFAAASHVHATLAGGAGLTGGPYDGGGAVTFDVGAGNGLTATASSVALGPLTADWTQAGPYDIVLDNAGSDLRIRGSAGAFHGTLDVGVLAASATYTFSGTSGTVWTSGNDGVGSGLAADTVDGVDSTSFLRSDVADAAAGRITFMGDPTGTGIGAGSVYINSVVTYPNETLLGVADNGTERFRVDAEGDAAFAGNLSAGNDASTTSNIAANARILSSTAAATYGAYGRAEDSASSGGQVYGVYGRGLASGAGNTKQVYGVHGTGTGGTFSTGVFGAGEYSGGQFEDLDTADYSYVAVGSTKITGNGSVAFVQNHPTDPDRVIVYNCPEGDEVATYTRGSARLSAGEARVALGETFAWVTNPDIGLTAHVTPRGEDAGLHVASVTPSELVVRSGDAGSNAAFDYVVYGLRIGFEEVSIVQQKHREARIPSMADHRRLYEKHPELQPYNALERFKDMRRRAGDDSPLDLTRSRHLHDAIEEFDPMVHPRLDPPEVVSPAGADPEETASRAPVAPASADGGGTALERPASLRPSSPTSLAERDVYGRSFRADLAELAQLLPVSGPVQVGDVLVVDRSDPSRVRACDRAADRAVVGIVVGEPGIALKGGMASIAEADPGLARQLDEARARDDGDAASRLWLELLAKFREANVPMAISGVVRCRVDARTAPVAIGDLLVSSPTPGHAMRAESASPGAVVAKALEPLEGGTGLIRVLVLSR